MSLASVEFAWFCLKIYINVFLHVTKTLKQLFSYHAQCCPNDLYIIHYILYFASSYFKLYVILLRSDLDGNIVNTIFVFVLSLFLIVI